MCLRKQTTKAKKMMNQNSIHKKLGRFKVQECFRTGAMYFYSRTNDVLQKNRYVKVIDQDNGKCIALPIVEEEGKERVVFHAKTIKQLVEFLEERSKEGEIKVGEMDENGNFKLCDSHRFF